MSKIPELKRVSYEHVKEVSKQIDENYLFVLLNWLLMIITIQGTTVVVIIVTKIGTLSIVKLQAR